MRAILLPSALAFATALCAQQAQKCCGTSNSTFLFGSATYARHTQMLYLPGDLTGATPGPITHLYFRYGTTAEELGNTLGNFAVRLGLTNETSFPNGNTFFTGLDLVLAESSFVIPPGVTGEWFVFSLETPFIYNPARTLIVDIQFETTEQPAFGTYGTTNNGRKLVSPDLASPTGSSTSTTWQDFGFDVNGTTGIADGLRGGALLWPNPTSEQAWLRWEQGSAPPAMVRLVDSRGRMALTSMVPQGRHEVLLDLSGLPAGFYTAHWSDALGASHGTRVLKE